MATSQHSTAADNPATSLLEINSMPIPLLKSTAQKTITKLCCMYWIVRSLSYKLNCLWPYFNVIFYFISVLWHLLRKELSNCSSWQNNLIFMKDLPKHWVNKTRMKSVYNQSFQENRFISQRQDKSFLSMFLKHFALLWIVINQSWILAMQWLSSCTFCSPKHLWKWRY